MLLMPISIALLFTVSALDPGPNNTLPGLVPPTTELNGTYFDFNDDGVLSGFEHDMYWWCQENPDKRTSRLCG
jgi:hypothetical protein